MRRSEARAAMRCMSSRARGACPIFSTRRGHTTDASNWGPCSRAAHYLLGEIKVHGANLRDPVKGYGAQDLHADVPKHFEDDWWVLNAMVLFDDMTLDNGPTRIVPGSHLWAPDQRAGRQPGRLGASGRFHPRIRPRVPADLGAPYPGEILVQAPAGAAVILNSSMWHAGTRKNQRRASAAPASHLHSTRPAAAVGPARLLSRLSSMGA